MIKISMLLFLLILIGCNTYTDENNAVEENEYKVLRNLMVKEQIELRGIKDENVLNAMRKVERHKFVPVDERKYAYADHPLPIGYNQTISQPYIVAIMTELAKPQPDQKVLEIGTGSGYQSAILAEIVGKVYTVEIVKPLYEKATKTLKELGYKNIFTKQGDGYFGWKDHAPYDAILVTAAPREIPKPLEEQLRVGGRLVIPLGDNWQELMVITKTEKGIIKKTIIPVRFVPMTGEALQ
jgi:protein-L-isoaspartate(D-aspartate) O-methyltransferase